MICPHCGKKIAENSKFCEFCGLPVYEVQPAPKMQTSGQSPKPESKPTPQPASGSAKSIKSLIATLLIIAGLGVGGYAVWNYFQNITPPDPAPVSYANLHGYDAVLSERHLTYDDLQGKSAWELKVMRNSIYAVHGYTFKRGSLYKHFSQYDWYRPDEEDPEVVYYRMSLIEQDNVKFIKNYEKTHNH